MLLLLRKSALRIGRNVPVVVSALRSIELDQPVVDARHILCVVGIEVGSGLTAEDLRHGGVFVAQSTHFAVEREKWQGNQEAKGSAAARHTESFTMRAAELIRIAACRIA